MKSIKILFTIIIFMISTSSFAHKDRILSINDNGIIEELPLNFGIPSLTFEYLDDKENEFPVQSLQLKIGNNQTKIPRCLTKYLRKTQYKDIQITASWHHGEDNVNLPYYINITFPVFEDLKKESASYSFLFNVRTTKLLEFKKIILGLTQTITR